VGIFHGVVHHMSLLVGATGWDLRFGREGRGAELLLLSWFGHIAFASDANEKALVGNGCCHQVNIATAFFWIRSSGGGK